MAGAGWPRELELGSVAATMAGGGRHDFGRVVAGARRGEVGEGAGAVREVGA